MVVIMTYASFSDEHTNIRRSALWIVTIDTGVAIVAGVMMFSFLFSHGMPSGAGPGLVFISMPTVFFEMGWIGWVFGLLFFIALAFAGITSAISILEPTVAYLEQRLKWSRKKATWLPVAVVYLIGAMAVLSNIEGFGWIAIAGMGLFDFMDFVTAAVMLPAGGFLMAIFIGYVMDKNQVRIFLEHRGFSRPFFAFWFWTMRYLVPVAVVAVMLYSMGVIS